MSARSARKNRDRQSQPSSSGNGRTVHLVDVENLAGASHVDVSLSRAIADLYAHAADLQPGDQVVVASSHHNASSTWFGWGAAARRLVRSGADGADLALLDVIDSERLTERFAHIVIGSGDGIFAEAAARLRAAGANVTVISRGEGLSAKLRRAVSDVRLLALAEDPQVAVAG